VILGYFEDGPDLVTLAMNGWGAADPAWWLNLQAHPDARVQLVRPGGAGTVAGAVRALDPGLDGYARRRPGETAVVILQRAGSTGPTRPAPADAR
jgi:F420H(2)-dependent quinone reductase